MLVYLVACQSATDTNTIGGDTNLDLTKVGGKFPIYIETQPFNKNLERISDSTVITKNDNGLVTFYHYSTFDSVFARALDTALGMEALPSSFKMPVIFAYLKKFGGTLDTTNKAKMILTAEYKAKITSEGIQEFFSSNGDISKPHTLIKYDWAVGNVYEFTNSDGIKVKRTVVFKSSDNDYTLGFLR